MEKTNIHYCFQLLQRLAQNGVRTFCVCPSARNAPLAEVLFQSKNMDVLQFFDERSAAFFALGRSKRDQESVAVVTTSGTAVCELYPALVEAYYSNASLIYVTADRPLEYKDTGAPQCIHQVNIFSQYVQKEWDISIHQANVLKSISWNPHQSVHINVRLDEPLIDSNISLCSKKIQPALSKNQPPLKKITSEESQQIHAFFKQSKYPVILLSELPFTMKDKMESFLLSLKLPIYAEPLSQLRESSVLKKWILKSGENIFSKSLERKWIDGVIRIGGVPVTRFWRDLNNMDLPVLSFSPFSFSGLKNRPSACTLNALWDADFLSTTHHSALFTWDQEQYQKNIVEYLQKNTFSEYTWIHYLSQKIPSSSHIFLGNSLPIREWDQWATRENKNRLYSANRGANGIDGLLSSFFGLCSTARPNYCILGDLSTLYDLSAPWILNQIKNMEIHIIVVNNFGGQIFKNKFDNPRFLNRHHIQFKDWSRMWSMHYQCLNNPDHSLIHLSPSLTEIPIHSVQTKVQN